MNTQCKHTRRTGTITMHRCERPAVRDGYCTRHHPSYVSPSHRRAEERWEAERAAKDTEVFYVNRKSGNSYSLVMEEDGYVTLKREGLFIAIGKAEFEAKYEQRRRTPTGTKGSV